MNAVSPVFLDQSSAEKLTRAIDEARRVVPEGWSVEFVALRLIEGFQTLAKLPLGSTLPKEFGNGWPGIVRSFADIRDAEPNRDVKEFTFEKAKKRASAEEIARMEESLYWPMKYLRGRPTLAIPLHVWALCKAHDWSIAKELKRRSLNRATFDRRKDAALKVVRRGLIADEVPIR